jgi:hypothetical protein
VPPVGQDRRNCCITGARNWCPGGTQGQIGRIEIATSGVLRERSLPELLERSEVPISTPPQRELPLSNPMGKFDTGQCDGCTPKGLEASHRGASAFDRPARQTPRQRLAEECLCSGDTAIWAEQKIHRLAMLVDSPIEIIPLALDLDVGFIDAPRIIHGSGEAVPALLKFRHIANNPAMNCGVRHANLAFSHHRHQISIAQPVGDVPNHRRQGAAGACQR